MPFCRRLWRTKRLFWGQSFILEIVFCNYKIEKFIKIEKVVWEAINIASIKDTSIKETSIKDNMI